ncbi:hypothetical protein RAS1_40270 [Phycisphaerae bacterium RAS1]|nr:hypothetical protein RAS1_40270 [Phycisphaerae bacterium RAS1]
MNQRESASDWRMVGSAHPAHFSRRAFTLMELLLVVALLGLLSILVFPNLGSIGHAEDLVESGRRVKTTIAMCRAQAMADGRRYRMTIRQDGRIRVERQVDPITKPQEYEAIPSDWARLAILLDDIWVDQLLPLPDGPPPILVEDDEIEFTEFDDLELTSVTELEAEFALEFEPDGSSTSARWIIRDKRGAGIQMTLDGRLGRVDVVDAQAISGDRLSPPPLIEDENLKGAPS